MKAELRVDIPRDEVEAASGMWDTYFSIVNEFLLLIGADPLELTLSTLDRIKLGLGGSKKFEDSYTDAAGATAKYSIKFDVTGLYITSSVEAGSESIVRVLGFYEYIIKVYGRIFIDTGKAVKPLVIAGASVLDETVARVKQATRDIEIAADQVKDDLDKLLEE